MEKLLVIFGLIQRASGRRLFQRLLPNILMVAGLVLVIAIMVSAALVGGLIVVYFGLLGLGLTSTVAFMIIAIIVLFTIGMLVLLAHSFVERLRRMPRTLIEKSPLASRAMDTLDAFTDGLMAD